MLIQYVMSCMSLVLDGTNRRRDQLKQTLGMISNTTVQNSTRGAGKVRDALRDDFWRGLP